MAEMIEVAYALPHRQWLIPVSFKEGMTIRSAIVQSGLLEEIDGLELNRCKVGVFGELGHLDQLVQPGDRVEIYRPLTIDPKEARRQRVHKPLIQPNIQRKKSPMI